MKAFNTSNLQFLLKIIPLFLIVAIGYANRKEYINPPLKNKKEEISLVERSAFSTSIITPKVKNFSNQ